MVDDMDAYVVEAGWSMSWFIQSLVNQGYVNFVSECWWQYEQCFQSWTWRAVAWSSLLRRKMQVLTIWWCLCLLLCDAGVCCLVIPEKVCWCLLLSDAGANPLVSAAWWFWNRSSSWCRCLLLKDAGTLLVCCESGWLLCCRLMVSAKKCSQETGGDPQKTFWSSS